MKEVVETLTIHKPSLFADGKPDIFYGLSNSVHVMSFVYNITHYELQFSKLDSSLDLIIHISIIYTYKNCKDRMKVLFSTVFFVLLF